MPDFRMQQNFPIPEVVNAAQRKAALEQQARDSANKSLIEGLQGIGQIGESLLARRQRMAQAMLLSQQPDVKDMLSGGDQTVAQGPMGAVRMDQTAQGGVGQEPKSNAPPGIPPHQAALLLEGANPLEVLKQAFARKQSMKPVEDVIAQKDAAGNIVGFTHVPRQKGGKTLIAGPQPVGAGAGSKDERTRQLAAARIKEKVTTDLNEIGRGKQQIESLFSKYQALVKGGQAGDPMRGGFNALASRVTGGGFGTGDVKSFLDIRNGLIASLKRITGDTGVLTEQDATRLVGLLSSLTESPEAAESKIAEIRAVFDGAAARSQNKGNTLIKEIQSGSDITPIDSNSILNPAPAPQSKDVLSIGGSFHGKKIIGVKMKSPPTTAVRG